MIQKETFLVDWLRGAALSPSSLTILFFDVLCNFPLRYTQFHSDGEYLVKTRAGALGVWSHVAIVFNGHDVALYLNGNQKLVDGTRAGGPFPPGNGDLQIGRKYTGEAKNSIRGSNTDVCFHILSDKVLGLVQTLRRAISAFLSNWH